MKKLINPPKAVTLVEWFATISEDETLKDKLINDTISSKSEARKKRKEKKEENKKP